jgi:hypothetical protein
MPQELLESNSYKENLFMPFYLYLFYTVGFGIISIIFDRNAY